MTATVIKLPNAKSKGVQLVCSKCFSKSTASCDCGVAYVPANVAAAKAIKAHPEKSNVALAKEIGVGKDTIRRVRSTCANAQVEKRIGLDGKTRKMPCPPVLEIVNKGRVDTATEAATRSLYNCACESYALAKRSKKYLDEANFEQNVIDAISDAAKAWKELLDKVTAK